MIEFLSSCLGAFLLIAAMFALASYCSPFPRRNRLKGVKTITHGEPMFYRDNNGLWRHMETNELAQRMSLEEWLRKDK